MPRIHATDGTAIAFDRGGEGRPLILVDGATSHRAVNPLSGQLAELLGTDFAVYAYDRRGRGESGDTAPYAVEREIEDIGALIAEAGGTAVVCGVSSGAVLAVDAAASGLPIERVAVYEPPFVVDDSRPPVPADYVSRLDEHLAAGRRADALELFFTTAVGIPAEFVAQMRTDPSWAALEAIAPTLAYDGRIMGTTMSGAPLPADRWAAVTTPTLVMHGGASDQWLSSAAQALADLLPEATLQVLEGQQHNVAADALAPALTRFFTSADRV
jgi:pimeloyl-ACP methyl ester carboxylesterase